MELPDSPVETQKDRSSPAIPSTIDTSEILTALRDAASKVLQRRFRVVLLVRSAYERMTTHSTVMTAVWDDLRTMLRLLARWADQSYQRISWTPLILIVAAVIYFITPTDVIPDVLGALGFVDDVTVITTVVQRIRGELDRFRTWEQRTALPD